MFAMLGLGASVLAQAPTHQPTAGAKMSSANSVAPSYVGATREKLSQIIIPQLTLRDATLTEAFQLLERLGRELDPEKKGIAFTIDAAAAAKASSVTISLQNISLLAAMNYLNELTGTGGIIADGCVIVIPIQQGARIVQKRLSGTQFIVEPNHVVIAPKR
jgi:hypothetical protein